MAVRGLGRRNNPESGLVQIRLVRSGLVRSKGSVSRSAGRHRIGAGAPEAGAGYPDAGGLPIAVPVAWGAPGDDAVQAAKQAVGRKNPPYPAIFERL